MSSKNDVPDFTGQWLCCRQEDMDKLLEINTNNILNSTDNTKFPKKDFHIFGGTLNTITLI